MNEFNTFRALVNQNIQRLKNRMKNLQGNMQQLQNQLRNQMNKVKGNMQQLQNQLRGQINQLDQNIANTLGNINNYCQNKPKIRNTLILLFIKV